MELIKFYIHTYYHVHLWEQEPNIFQCLIHNEA